jgi:outer membrane assembly lipoprotein YfiO
MTSPDFSSRPARRTFLLPACALALLAAACSSSKKLTQQEDCQAKFDKLQAKFDKKKFQDVREPLSDLISSCPGSPFTEQAAFEVGEANYHVKDWTEAEIRFSEFFKDYPSSRRFGEAAHYHYAMSMANQVEIPARDQSKTAEAITAFESFMDEFPDSKYADSSKPQIDRLRNVLVAKQMQIARLYTRMDEPQAAAIYYKDILKQYGTLVNQRDINLKLADCYIEMNQFDEAESYLAKFDGIAADDPFKAQVKQTYQKLEKARTKLARDKKEEQEQGKRQEAM